MSFSSNYLKESIEIINRLQPDIIDLMAETLAVIRERGGRLFILGVGGSAASASHAVNDFRKICGLEAYAPTDNVSELTARTNDEGWDSTFAEYLKGSRLSSMDGILVMSVGGGNLEKNISPNLVKALELAKRQGSAILGLVGRDGGHTAKMADVCVIIPTVNANHVTPHTEAFHGLVWHLLVSHPALKAKATMWESVSSPA
jgi:D-sedoheptulose 7-phosphate isomerase